MRLRALARLSGTGHSAHARLPAERAVMQQEEVVRMLPACGSGQPLLAAALAVDAGAAALTVSGPEPAAPTMWERLLRGGRTRRKLDATSSSDASGAYLHDSAGKRMAHTCAAGLPTAVAAGDGARQQQRIAQIRPARAQPRQQAALAGRPGETDLSLGAAVVYCPTAFSAAESRALYESLKEGGAGWQEREVTVFGRRVMQPRLVAYMADDASLAYTYSGTTMVPQPWTEPVRRIKERIEELAGTSFNSCLLNYYRSGADNMGYHSDNEPLYGRHPTIGSVSFGSPRDFMLRCNEDHTKKFSFPLGNGDVLLMKGTTQDHWMHAVPKRSRTSSGRINLTFRKIVKKEQL